MRSAIFVVKTGESLGYGEKAINFTDFNVAADINEEEESVVILSIKKLNLVLQCEQQHPGRCLVNMSDNYASEDPGWTWGGRSKY